MALGTPKKHPDVLNHATGGMSASLNSELAGGGNWRVTDYPPYPALPVTVMDGRPGAVYSSRAVSKFLNTYMSTCFVFCAPALGNLGNAHMQENVDYSESNSICASSGLVCKCAKMAALVVKSKCPRAQATQDPMEGTCMPLPASLRTPESQITSVLGALRSTDIGPASTGMPWTTK
eukprot:3884389-Pyramimonas_sp.AAC.1